MVRGQRDAKKVEAFCAEYVRNGGNATAAYDIAFPPTLKKTRTHGSTKQQASLLLRDPNVTERIAQLHAAIKERTETSLEQISRRLDESYEMAKAVVDPKAMTAAALGKAKLHGLLVDKAETTHTHEIGPNTARQILASLAEKYLPK